MFSAVGTFSCQKKKKSSERDRTADVATICDRYIGYSARYSIDCSNNVSMREEEQRAVTRTHDYETGNDFNTCHKDDEGAVICKLVCDF